MDSIIANASQLTLALLETEEEEYDNLALQVLQALRKLPVTDPNKILEVLHQIDSSTLTIPYVFLLHAIIDIVLSSSKSTSARSLPQSLLPEGKIWPEITSALLSFDPVQVRYVGHQFSRIIEVVYFGAETTSNFVPAIQVLQNVILRLDPTSSTFSTTHYYFVKSCLYARAYSEATIILDRAIYHIPTLESTKTLEKRLGKYLCSVEESSLGYINPQSGLSGKVTNRVYLEYYLLGAMCYIGAKQWKQAQAFLEVVLVCPTQQSAASVIMLEAYRKWLLLGLIINGEGFGLPRAASVNAMKHIRALAKPYECVVEAFKKRHMDVLQAEIQEGLQFWNDDGNFGLMSEVVAAFTKFAVIRLSKTFAALPIEEVSRRVFSDKQDVQTTLLYVEALIASGQLKAQVTSSQTGAGIVRFLTPFAAQKTEAEVEKELIVKAMELKVLLKHVADYDHQLEVNKDYLEWLQKAKKSRDQDKKATQTANNSKPFGAPPGPEIADEDMMDDW